MAPFEGVWVVLEHGIMTLFGSSEAGADHRGLLTSFSGGLERAPQWASIGHSWVTFGSSGRCTWCVPTGCSYTARGRFAW